MLGAPGNAAVVTLRGEIGAYLVEIIRDMRAKLGYKEYLGSCRNKRLGVGGEQW